MSLKNYRCTLSSFTRSVLIDILTYQTAAAYDSLGTIMTLYIHFICTSSKPHFAFMTYLQCQKVTEGYFHLLATKSFLFRITTRYSTFGLPHLRISTNTSAKFPILYFLVNTTVAALSVWMLRSFTSDHPADLLSTLCTSFRRTCSCMILGKMHN